MDALRASSFGAGETRSDDPPASTTSSSPALENNSNLTSAKSTPPTSVSDQSEACESCDATEKNDTAPAIGNMPVQPETVPVEAVAATPTSDEQMPPPPTTNVRRSRRSNIGPKCGTYNADYASSISAGTNKKQFEKSQTIKLEHEAESPLGAQELNNIPFAQPSPAVVPDTSTPLAREPAQVTNVDAEADAQSPPDQQPQDLSMLAESRDGTTEEISVVARRKARRAADMRAKAAEMLETAARLEREAEEEKKKQATGQMKKENKENNTPGSLRRRMTRELKRLSDTAEFEKTEQPGVKYIDEIWINGKKAIPGQPPPTFGKKTKEDSAPEEPMAEPEPVPEPAAGEPAKTEKFRYLQEGIYKGAETLPFFPLEKRHTEKEKRKIAKVFKPRKILPFPIASPNTVGYLMLNGFRDFKLPFEVHHPTIGRGQPQPPEYKTLSKSRFVGDSKSQWVPENNGYGKGSRCQCDPGYCGYSCMNRTMMFECDETNCPSGIEDCTNRAFANLAERTARGGRYQIGVEVVRTDDRGFGVRAHRYFNEDQIILEYCGEIITEEESDRRMNEVYKDNECFYLMSFTQGMIIDATRGNMARFVNHSCDPNCVMSRWEVQGKPRMALFARREIRTGEELTYDYKFSDNSKDPTKRQVCRCGANNCRGYLGAKDKDDKKKDQKDQNSSLFQKAGSAAKLLGKATKRKVNDFLGAKPEEDKTPTKRARIPSTKATKSAPARAFENVKGNVKKVARSVSAVARGNTAASAANVTPKLTLKSTSIQSAKSTAAFTRSTGPAKKQMILRWNDNNHVKMVRHPKKTAEEEEDAENDAEFERIRLKEIADNKIAPRPRVRLVTKNKSPVESPVAQSPVVEQPTAVSPPATEPVRKRITTRSSTSPKKRTRLA